MQNNFTSLNGSIHSLFNQRFSFKHLAALVASVLVILCAVWLPYALFWQLDGLLSLQQAQILGSTMFYGGIASFVAIAVVTRFRLSKDWSLKRNVGLFSVLLLTTLVFSSLLSAPVVAALTPLPSDSGPNGSSAYKFSVPFSEYKWFVSQFRDGTYYAINGSDWNIMTIVEPWQPVAPWAALAGNKTALVEQVLSVTDPGKVLLNELSFDYALTVPENVTVVESLNGLTRSFINSANSQGSPYTVSVDTVNPTYYLAQDSADRYINEWSSTNAFTVIQSTLLQNSRVFFKNGDYNVGSNTLWVNNSNVQLQGESLNASISGSGLPMLAVYGSDLVLPGVLTGIAIKDLTLNWTGASSGANGCFIRLRGLENDFSYQGRNILDNVVITNGHMPRGYPYENVIQGETLPYTYSQERNFTVPTNENFIGLDILDSVGIEFTGVNIAGFGTSVHQNSTQEADQFIWTDCQFSVGKMAFSLEGNGGRQIHIGSKFMYFYGGTNVFQAVGGANSITMIATQWESITATNVINVNIEGSLEISNSKLSAFTTGIIFGSNSVAAQYKQLIVTGTRFWSGTTGIVNYANGIFESNEYINVVHPVNNTGNWGTSNPISKEYMNSLALIPTTGWTTVGVVGGSAITQYSDYIDFHTDSSNSTSVISAYKLMYGLGSASRLTALPPNYISYEQPLSFEFKLASASSRAENTVVRVQLKGVTAVGDLTSQGNGIGWIFNGTSIYGESYGSASRGLTNVLSTEGTINRINTYRIDVYRSIGVYFYINNQLVGSLSGTAVPSATNNAYIVVSGDNGGNAASNSWIISQIKILTNIPT